MSKKVWTLTEEAKKLDVKLSVSSATLNAANTTRGWNGTQFYGLETDSSDDDYEEEEEELGGPAELETSRDLEKAKSDFSLWNEQEQEKNPSIIPEVAAAIPVRRSKEDVDLPVMTLRVLTISTLLCCLSAIVGQSWYFRYNHAVLDSVAHIALSYPIGVFFAYFTPSVPFNYKEHTMILIICASTTSIPYQSSLLFIQRLINGGPDTVLNPASLFQNPPSSSSTIQSFWIFIAFIFATQVLGMFLGGLLTRVLVDPAQMWYPQNLIFSTMIHSLHQGRHNRISRLRTKMLGIVLVAGSIYQLLPAYFMPLLQSVPILCLVFGGTRGNVGDPIGFTRYASSSVSSLMDSRSYFAQLSSGNFGGGVLTVSLDWTAVSKFAPLTTPLWATLNILMSNIIFAWVIVPFLVYYNFLNASLFPAFGVSAYTFNGTLFNLTNVISVSSSSTASSQTQAALLSTSRVLILFCGIAGVVSILVHFVLYYLGPILAIFSSRKQLEKEDLHTEIIKNQYETVPVGFFGFLSLLSIGGCIWIVQAHQDSFELDFWMSLVAILWGFLLSMPIGIITAISNQSIAITDINQFIMGSIKPGSLLANVAFDVLSSTTMMQIVKFATLTKLGYYMRISPRTVLVGTIWGAFISSIANYATLDYILKTVPAVWDAANGTFDGTMQWNSQLTRTAISSAIFWGRTSPIQNFTSLDSPYLGLLWYFFGAGVILPLLFFSLFKLFPNIGFQYVNWPIIFQSAGLITTSGSNGVLSALVLSILSQSLLKNFRRVWFDRYIHTIQAGMDFVVFFIPLILFTLKNLGMIPHGQFALHPMNPDPSIYGPDYCGKM